MNIEQLLIWAQGSPILAPLQGLYEKAAYAFIKSLSLMIMVLFAAIPWFVFLAIVGWGILKLLRIWIRHKREMKQKKQQT